MKFSRLPLIGPIFAQRAWQIADQAIEDYKASVKVTDEELGLNLVEVPAELLAKCQIVSDRTDMLAKLSKGGIWCEVGVFEGEFSEQILSICKPDILHLIDIWDLEHDISTPLFEAVKQRLQGHPVEIHKGYSSDVLASFPDDHFDVIYIDASHEYNDVVVDLELSRQKVKPEGVISGHDYVTGTWQTQYRYGVIEAVNAFFVKYQWEFIMVSWESHRHISYVIRKV